MIQFNQQHGKYGFVRDSITIAPVIHIELRAKSQEHAEERIKQMIEHCSKDIELIEQRLRDIQAKLGETALAVEPFRSGVQFK